MPKDDMNGELSGLFDNDEDTTDADSMAEENDIEANLPSDLQQNAQEAENDQNKRPSSSEASSDSASSSSKAPSASDDKDTSESDSSKSKNSSASSNEVDNSSANSKTSYASRKSVVASQKSLQKQSSSIESEQTNADISANGLDGHDDPQIKWLMNEAQMSLNKYVRQEIKNYDHDEEPTKKEFRAKLDNLSNSFKYMVEAISGLWNEYNSSIVKINKRITILERQHVVDKKFNPQKEMNTLIRWAKTGVPSRMEKDFYRLDKVANDPRFDEMLKSGSLTSKIPTPSAVPTMYHSLESEHSQYVSSIMDTKNQGKGGSSNANKGK